MSKSQIYFEKFIKSCIDKLSAHFSRYTFSKYTACLKEDLFYCYMNKKIMEYLKHIFLLKSLRKLNVPAVSKYTQRVIWVDTSIWGNIVTTKERLYMMKHNTERRKHYLSKTWLTYEHRTWNKLVKYFSALYDFVLFQLNYCRTKFPHQFNFILKISN